MTDILTVDDLAAMLKMSKSQIYKLTQARTESGELRKHPLPVLRIGTSVRFRKADVEVWINQLAATKKG
jgi:excisionase family DNA binding protein